MTQGQCFSLLSLLVCCLESFPAGSTCSFLEHQHELIEFFILLDTIGNHCVLPQWIYGALLPLQSLVWMPCLPLLAWVMWFVAGHGCVRPFLCLPTCCKPQVIPVTVLPSPCAWLSGARWAPLSLSWGGGDVELVGWPVLLRVCPVCQNRCLPQASGLYAVRRLEWC